MKVIATALVLAACSTGDSSQSDVLAESATDTGSAAARSPNADDLVRNTYNVAHEVCGHDPNGVYKESGSRSVHAAAEWYSAVSQTGAHRAASYRGCADALLGMDKNY